ncbi:hypothetical protein JG688_00014221 [Phytophthora aleatoria]|uniref:Uncharacterized protein n=1 Tax=Phytophthora aleatoria TaxID=2496075 RepID=A0A8J5IKH9_9STRA|nr:hypothetical protein JG688_00014221 [Phytophthora aleatoria]
MRGKTKIPLPGQKFTSPLRSAGADIVKGLASKDETQSSLPLQELKRSSTPLLLLVSSLTRRSHFHLIHRTRAFLKKRT